MTEKARLETIEEFGRLSQKIKGYADDETRHEQLRELIQGWYDSAPPGEEITVQSPNYVLVVGERAWTRSLVRMPALAKLLGKRFFELCKIGLADFDAHVPEPQRDKFQLREQSGSRKVKVIAKREVAKAA